MKAFASRSVSRRRSRVSGRTRPALILALCSCLALLAASGAQAKRFYVGGGIGPTFVNQNLRDINDQAFKIDDENFGWKLFGGVRPLKFVAGELGYRSLGSSKAASRD